MISSFFYDRITTFVGLFHEGGALEKLNLHNETKNE